MMFDRRLIQYFDWGLLGLTTLIVSIGLVALYSALNVEETSPERILFTKQLVWYGCGLVGMVISFLFSYKSIERWGHVIYIISMGLLIFVVFFGRVVAGSKRWLVMGPVSIQPSEMAKLAVAIMLARYYAKVVNTDGLGIKELWPSVILTAVPFILIVRQPDLGTAMVVALISSSVTIFTKIEKRTFMYLTTGGVLTVPLVWFFLKSYQKQRILTFLNPDRDPLGAGYHIIQSKIAIGSGMFTGRGFLKGTQNALSFLPEQHTDFIFSVLAEEWGFLGSTGVIVVFLFIIVWGLNIAYGCRDPFGTILSVGITAMIAWQVVINIGMVMGLLPVVGVTLPFLSYGGSSVITLMISIGILLNISMRRFMFE
jgi:rod shape determining protein RodA